MAQLQRCCRALQCFAPRRARPAPGGARCVASAASGPPPGSQAQRLVAHILLRDATGAGSATARLDGLEAQLRSGTPFGQLASEASEDRSSARKGGVLGWMQRGTFYPEFEEAAFGASVGDVVRASTSLGEHLIEIKEERFIASVQQVSVQELSEMLSDPELVKDVQLIDVREPWEEESASLPYFRLFPLSKLQVWGPSIAEQLDPSRETLVLCHHGVRSMQVATFLVSNAGFTNVKNVTSGIHAYSTQVDASVLVY